MLNNSWKLNHVGHVVKDLEKSVNLYEKFFGFKVIERETLTEQKVQIAFLAPKNTNPENTLIELLTPLPENTTLTNFLTKRGEGLHHLCYQVKSVSTELKRLGDLGVSLIDQFPKIGSRGFHIAFIHPRSTNGVLTELCGDY